MRVCLLAWAAVAAQAQPGTAAAAGAQSSSAVQLPLSGRSGTAGSANAAQTPAPGATSSINTLNPSVQVQGAFAGSVAEPKPVAGDLALGIREAIRRGLEFNLGAAGFTNALRQARGQATASRGALLPNISANVRETVQKTNLAAMGVRIPFAPSVVGPFNFFDLRATLTQSLFDFTTLNNYRASRENIAAAEQLMADARDTVVFAVAGAYLQAVTAQARVDVAKAQLATARTLFQQAAEQNKQGVLALVDANRSRVQMQTQEQRLITLENDVAKQKLNLARMIGLAPGQAFTLADAVPFSPAAVETLEAALERALASRADLRAAEAQLRAAERVRAAARAERLPSLAVSADYGAIGTNPAQAVGTYALTANLRIPIWQGGRTSGNIEQAAAAVDQRRAELSDLRGRIDQEIRNAFLDLESAANQVQVARSNLEVARQSLDLTRQRFDAGVTDTAEVVRAQETLQTAEHDLITSAFSHNLAKAALARAMGRAEETMPAVLGLQ
jgi:outer membrane protein TolC